MKVDVVIPSRGWVRKELLGVVLTLQGDQRHELRYFVPQGEPIDHLRNCEAARAVADGVDAILFIDSDNPPLEPAKCLDFVGERDIVVFPTPMWVDHHVDDGRVPVVWNIFDDEPGGTGRWTGRAPGALFEAVGAGGTGCMLIATRVFEKVKPPFMRSSDDWGRVVHGSDLLFCRRAREAGFSVHAAWGHPCHHLKEVDLWRVFQSMRARDVSAAGGPNINTRDYWDGQWGTRPAREIEAHRVIADLALSAGPRVLDYGCGCGDVLRLLGAQGEGVDISPVAVERCRKAGLAAGLVFKRGDPDLLGDGWDAVVLSSVLEHVDDDEALVRDLAGRARRLVVAVPDNRLPPGLEPEHRRVYTRASLVALLGPGAQCVEVDGYLVGWIDNTSKQQQTPT